MTKIGKMNEVDPCVLCGHPEGRDNQAWAIHRPHDGWGTYPCIPAFSGLTRMMNHPYMLMPGVKLYVD